MTEPVAAGRPTALAAPRADDAAAMLLSLAADLPHPPRARPLPGGADDALAPLADWAARTAAGSASGRASAPAALRPAALRTAVIDACGPRERAALPAILAAAGLPPATRSLTPHGGDLPAAAADAQRAVDACLDDGADLLLIVGDGLDRAPALAIVSLLCRVEPAGLMPYATTRDDAAWMGELAAIRDARRAAARPRASAAHGLCAAGGAALVAATAALLHAARRGVPVIVDGLTPTVAALVAATLAPGIAGWWRRAGGVAAPAEPAIAARLELSPLCPLGADAATGAAGALAVAMVRMAVAGSA